MALAQRGLPAAPVTYSLTQMCLSKPLLQWPGARLSMSSAFLGGELEARFLMGRDG